MYDLYLALYSSGESSKKMRDEFAISHSIPMNHHEIPWIPLLSWWFLLTQQKSLFLLANLYLVGG